MNSKIYLKQYLKKKNKYIKGFYKTHIKQFQQGHAVTHWWDHVFYKENLKSDASTISRYTPEIVSEYYYKSIEMAILSLLFNNNIDPKNLKVCDIGSGTGHWIDFYKNLQASKIVGIDVSERSCEFLRNRFINKEDDKTIIEIKQGFAIDNLKDQYDLINAIGVMFHIVDDKDWEMTIKKISESLKPNGVFIASGHFGSVLNNINVQFNEENHVQMRLRSLSKWKKVLKNAGFKKIIKWDNDAYLKIDWLIPESNVIIAFK